MKLLRLSLMALTALSLCVPSWAESVTFDGKEYQLVKKIERKIGPGTIYTRLRLEHSTAPLNVNLLTVDLNNPYNRIETTIANETARGTETLVKAAARQSSPGHQAIAGANANFWVVSSQNEYPLYSGITRNASVRNGKMVTESNQHKEKWGKGTQRTGVTAISYDRTLHVDYCTSLIKATWNTGGTTIHQCNKGFRDEEVCMYNSFYGKTREFMPYVLGGDTGKVFTLDEGNTSTEIMLSLKPGSQWSGGNPVKFLVKEVRTNAGHGTLGDYDLALVGRGATVGPKLAALAVGTEVTLTYNWTFEGNVKPIIEQAIGGNAMVMRDGVLTEHNDNEAYNSQVYSRTGYGSSPDGKTLYIIVIDKSTDPVYGKSAGCNTRTMCEIARHFGCSNMQNYDAGGSAEMLVGNAIINKTTETTPRPVANGWLVYSTAPDDSPTITSIAFDHPEIKLSKGETFTPTILGYDRYDNLRDKDLKGFTLTCSPGLGTCAGNTFVAADKDATGTLTATYNGVMVTKTVTVGAGDPSGIETPTSTLNIPSALHAGETFTITAPWLLLQVSLVDLDGHILFETTPQSQEFHLQAPLRPGLYLLNIVTPHGHHATKLLVQ